MGTGRLGRRRLGHGAVVALALLAAASLAGCDPVVVQPPPPVTPVPAPGTAAPAVTAAPDVTPVPPTAAPATSATEAPATAAPAPTDAPGAAVAPCEPTLVGAREQLGTMVRIVDERPGPATELWLTWSREPREGVDGTREAPGTWCRIPAGGEALVSLGGDDSIARAWLCDPANGPCAAAETPDGQVYAELDPSFTGDLTTCTARSAELRICKSGVAEEVTCPCDLGDGTRIIGAFRFERLTNDAWADEWNGPYMEEWPKVILRVRSVA